MLQLQQKCGNAVLVDTWAQKEIRCGDCQYPLGLCSGPWNYWRAIASYLNPGQFLRNEQLHEESGDFGQYADLFPGSWFRSSGDELHGRAHIWYISNSAVL